MCNAPPTHIPGDCPGESDWQKNKRWEAEVETRSAPRDEAREAVPSERVVVLLDEPKAPSHSSIRNASVQLDGVQVFVTTSQKAAVAFGDALRAVIERVAQAARGAAVEEAAKVAARYYAGPGAASCDQDARREAGHVIAAAIRALDARGGGGK